MTTRKAAVTLTQWDLMVLRDALKTHIALCGAADDMSGARERAEDLVEMDALLESFERILTSMRKEGADDGL